MKASKKLILIDDDPSNNFMCCQVLKKLCIPAPADIAAFTLVHKGILRIEEELSHPENQVVLFLDINMPSQMDGWEVLDHLSQLPDSMQNRLTVFMLSSSDRMSERQKSLGYRLVKKFIQKPMMTSMKWLTDEILYEQSEKANKPIQNWWLSQSHV